MRQIRCDPGVGLVLIRYFSLKSFLKEIRCHVLIFDFVLLGGESCYPPGWGDISLTARTRSGTL